MVEKCGKGTRHNKALILLGIYFVAFCDYFLIGFLYMLHKV